jgi:hypothetical protein
MEIKRLEIYELQEKLPYYKKEEVLELSPIYTDNLARPSIIFWLNDKKVGEFDLETLEFKGDVKESAKIFWQHVSFNGKTLYDKIAELESKLNV